MLDVITIGTATRDVFLTSPDFRRVHDPKHLSRIHFPDGNAECLPWGGKILTAAPIATIGGGAANAAVTFARHGLKTAAFLKIGEDENGRAIMADLKKEGVQTWPVYDTKLATGSSVLLLSPDGERTILHYRGASQDLATKDVPFEKLKARWAYIVPGNIPLEVMAKIVGRLHANGVKIAMNPSGFYVAMKAKKLSPILEKISVITLTREEGAELVGLAPEDEHAVFDKLHECVDGLAVITDGAKGAWVSDRHRRYVAGIYKEKRLIDRTGAGDAFGSGFVAGLIANNWQNGGDEEKAVTKAISLASANATSVVEYVGAQEGILTSKQFAHQSRWRKFPIVIKHL